MSDGPAALDRQHVLRTLVPGQRTPQAFHRSREFCSIPLDGRAAFLSRNPRVIALRRQLSEVRRIAQSASKRKRASMFDPAMQAATTLCEQFGIFDPLILAVLQDHGDPLLFAPAEITKHPFVLLSMADETFDHRTVPDVVALWDRLRESSTVRERRSAAAKIRDVERQHGARQYRHKPIARFQRMLRLWDRREGWTGDGYDSQRAILLRDAMMRTRAKKEDYYGAFRLVTGEDYSDIAWGRYFAPKDKSLSKYLGLRSNPQRRRAGRKAGKRSGSTKQSGLHHDPVAQSEDPSDQLQHAEEEAALRRLYDSLAQGVEVREAILQSGISADVQRKLLAHPDKVAAHFARRSTA